ncbi:MAG: hypothetical protein AAFN27_08700 [Pseudomonadota bacterium]
MPLIKPENVMKRDDWSGQSQHPQEPKMVPNKETGMAWAEHQRIVAEAASLVSGSGVPESLKNLKLALTKRQDEGKKSSVYVSKGIHQPCTNPHMQLQTETHTKNNGSWGSAYIQTYHLNVSAEAQLDIEGMTDKFTWKGVQFTIGDGGQGKRWPEIANPVKKKAVGASGRRNSISGPAYADRVKQIAREAEAAAAEEAFDKLCTAFEQLHKTKPIDRNVRNDVGSVWSPKTHKVDKANGTGQISFKYKTTTKELQLVA